MSTGKAFFLTALLVGVIYLIVNGHAGWGWLIVFGILAL